MSPVGEVHMLIDDMIKYQIEARGVRDKRVLEAMRAVPRHMFVPETLQSSAYDDNPLPIGEGQTISQPYMVALMTALLGLKGSEKVLEIGTGSGYQTAVLSMTAKEVYTVEVVPRLAQKAAKLLRDLGYNNINIKTGDGYLGWPEHSPYNGIIATAAPDEIPPHLVEQLAEGGRMVLPVGSAHQELMLLEKVNDEVIQHNILPVRFVPMVGSPS